MGIYNTYELRVYSQTVSLTTELLIIKSDNLATPLFDNATTAPFVLQTLSTNLEVYLCKSLCYGDLRGSDPEAFPIKYFSAPFT